MCTCNHCAARQQKFKARVLAGHGFPIIGAHLLNREGQLHQAITHLQELAYITESQSVVDSIQLRVEQLTVELMSIQSAKTQSTTIN